MRRRSCRANSGRGASGTTGSRNASNGSVIATPFVVSGTERVAGADEQRLGRVDGAIEMFGALGNGQSVEIAQRERGAVVRAELAEHFARADAIEVLVEAVVDDVGRPGSVASFSVRSSRASRRQWSTSLLRATVTSHAIVRSGTLSVAHRAHRGEERLAGQVLGDGRVVHPRRRDSRTPAGSARSYNASSRGPWSAAALSFTPGSSLAEGRTPTGVGENQTRSQDTGVAAGVRRGDHLGQLLEWERRRVEESLGVCAAEPAQRGFVLVGLHALRR